MKALIATYFILFAPASQAGEIAFTFDDAPTRDSVYMTGQERTKLLLKNLKEGAVNGAVFFVNSEKIGLKNRNRLTEYTSAGHVIGNHTHTHRGLKRLNATEFIEDIIQADKILTHFAGYKRWFRYPHLGRGKTKAERDRVYEFLSNNEYVDAYVTVDNFDFYMDSLFQKAVKTGKKIHFEELKDAYIFALWDAVKFYDGLALKTIGRSPRHILLLHENDLAAMFVNDLANFLRKKGWKIISAKKAYEDPISDFIPNTLRNGRIAAIASERGFSKKETRDKYQSKEAVEKLFEDRRVFRD